MEEVSSYRRAARTNLGLDDASNFHLHPYRHLYGDISLSAAINVM